MHQAFLAFSSCYIQEKVYLHLDKPYHSAGEDIWFQAYLVNGFTHLPDSTLSSLLYVELISPQNEITERKALHIQEGTAAGDFALPDTLLQGTYTIRAYTHYMRNFDAAYFFYKKITIWNTYAAEKQELPIYKDGIKNTFHVDFFPEGGNMVDGLVNHIGFKVINAAGDGVDMAGEIIDGTGEVVTSIQTFRFGIGAFILVPQPKKQYFAKFQFPNGIQIYPLPASLPKGYVMHIDNLKDRIKIKVQTSLPDGMNNGVVIGQMRGNIFCTIPTPRGKPVLLAGLPKDKLQSGVANFTFFDSNREHHCERLVFIDNPRNNLQVNISSDKATYGKREKVSLDIQVNNQQNQSLAAIASVAVIDANLLRNDDFANNIESYLLLSSELRGKIQCPGYYFIDDTPERRRALDFLMLTQGWRKFAWQKILNDTFPQLDYHLEKGFTIQGYVTHLYKSQQRAQATVSVLSIRDVLQMHSMETDEQGKFLFTGYQFTDSTRLSVRVQIEQEKKNGKKKVNENVVVHLQEYKPPLIDMPLFKPLESDTLAHILAYLERSTEAQKIDSTFDFDKKVKVLETIEVKAAKDKTQDPFYSPSRLYDKPDNRLVLDSLVNPEVAVSIFSLLALLPGVRVTGFFPNQDVLMRSGTSRSGFSSPIYFNR